MDSLFEDLPIYPLNEPPNLKRICTKCGNVFNQKPPDDVGFIYQCDNCRFEQI